MKFTAARGRVAATGSHQVSHAPYARAGDLRPVRSSSRGALRQQRARAYRWLGIVLVLVSLGMAMLLVLPGGSASALMERLRAAGLHAASGLLVVEDDLVPSDYIFVLNGSIEVRAGLAAALYRRGVAPRVLIAETPEVSQLIVEEMIRAGVPAPAIRVLPLPGGAINTRDEARALRYFLQQHPAKRVIVATTDFHTGRAKLILRQELRGTGVEIRMAGAPHPRGVRPDNWWRSEQGKTVYKKEFLKLACALVRCT